MKLYKNGVISFEEALAQATNPDDFDLRVRGITGTADRWEGDEESVAESEGSTGSDTDGFTKY
jgi:twitching motility protein PilT